MPRPESYDVIVVGGGVIGCATARELAPDHDVLVLEGGTAGGDTSPKASGLITTCPDFPDYPEACAYAMEFFHSYDGTGQFTFTPRPGINLVSAEEESWGREHATEMASHGFDVTYLTSTEIADRYPGALVVDKFVGGVVFDDCGWVDPYTYTMTLKADAEGRGAQYETNMHVEAVETDDGSVTGVRVNGETITADHVVCATGWRTRSLLSDLVEVPVRPFRWQTVNLEVSREFDEEFPMAWDAHSGMYWRPEHNGDLHVGGGTYFVENPGNVRSSITESFRKAVAEAVVDRVKDVEDARIKSEDCCPSGDAATPDDVPIIDAPSEAPDGLIVAITGPVGGIMCSPFVATAVRSLVTGESAPFPIEPYRLGRFENRSADFECAHVTERTVHTD
ncbi:MULTISPECIES: FAD-binding oxidoreductase [Haloferax]|uniref:FAD-dependent oxidoreductase n=1 Tax=Haloferax marinum TaxID=2666143 RepID=A0A6A8GBH7_9EURY|nr:MULTISPECIES: FAD-dependent oxidoreductase [Haloferax]KAB1190723.1 FAD-binding oxidoreductase [Haloferax sp. CBA1150]MRW98257.1 FAD-dependent oxidoreductase [Haloferax marinum]